MRLILKIHNTKHLDKLHFRPDSVDKYLKTQANLIGFINSQKEVLHGECLGNFNVLVGDQVSPGFKENETCGSQ